MNYCFMSTQKIKTMAALASKYNHNFRKVRVENVDPALFCRNEELIPLQNKQGKALDYNEAFRERASHLPHNIRSNAVLALEVLLTFSRDAAIAPDKWKEENIHWLRKTFDKAGDGKQNVISAIYHADEPGNVHCHAIVIPIDAAGRLNASYYINGSRALSEMQTSYAKDMKQFGLERGLQNGQARHQDIKKYYADLNRAKELPTALPDETAVEYRARVLENIEELQLAALKKRKDDKTKFDRKLAAERIRTRDKMNSEYDTVRKNVKNSLADRYQELDVLTDKISYAQADLERLEVQNEDSARELQKRRRELKNIDNINRAAANYRVLLENFHQLKEADPEAAEYVQSILENPPRQQDKEIEDNFPQER